MVKVGFAHPLVGKSDPPAQVRLGTPWTRPSGSQTELVGSVPMRVVPRLGRVPGDGPRPPLAARRERSLSGRPTSAASSAGRGRRAGHERASVERGRAVVDAEGAAEGVVALREGHPVVRVRLHLHEVAAGSSAPSGRLARGGGSTTPRSARGERRSSRRRTIGRRLARVLQVGVVPGLGVVAELDDLLLARPTRAFSASADRSR